jgi:hypothetical protein
VWQPDTQNLSGGELFYIIGDKIVIHPMDVNEKLVAHTAEMGAAATVKQAPMQ